jgi:putative copper resistance protein D
VVSAVAMSLIAAGPIAVNLAVSAVHLLSVWLAVFSDAAYALVIGTLLAGRWLVAAREHQVGDLSLNQFLLRRLLLPSVAVLILAHLVHPWFLAASMSGSDDFRTNLGTIPMILSSTHQGTLWYVNSAALIALVAVTVVGRVRRNGVVAAVIFATLCLIAFAKAASGHAADEGDFTLLELCQLVHILATAIWAGAILVSGLVVAPRLSRCAPRLSRSAGFAALWSYAGLLSKTVTWALGALLVSGIYTSDRELGNSLTALRTSAWGKILLIKLAFVVAAIALGAMNRLLCLKRPATAERSLLLRRLLMTEALLMVCILCLSGLLGSTAPPMAEM